MTFTKPRASDKLGRDRAGRLRAILRTGSAPGARELQFLCGWVDDPVLLLQVGNLLSRRARHAEAADMLGRAGRGFAERQQYHACRAASGFEMRLRAGALPREPWRYLEAGVRVADAERTGGFIADAAGTLERTAQVLVTHRAGAAAQALASTAGAWSREAPAFGLVHGRILKSLGLFDNAATAFSRTAERARVAGLKDIADRADQELLACRRGRESHSERTMPSLAMSRNATSGVKWDSPPTS